MDKHRCILIQQLTQQQMILGSLIDSTFENGYFPVTGRKQMIFSVSA